MTNIRGAFIRGDVENDHPKLASSYSFRVVGYMPTDSVPKEDYLDFMNARFSIDELKFMLKDGVLPPGLILNRGERTPSLQVWGAYGKKQKLVPVMAKIKMR